MQEYFPHIVNNMKNLDAGPNLLFYQIKSCFILSYRKYNLENRKEYVLNIRIHNVVMVEEARMPKF